MTTTPSRPKLLPLIPTGPHGSRSRMTCHYRCGDACDQPIPNQTGNEHIQDVVRTAIRRRSVLRGAAIGAGALAVGGLTTHALPAAAAGVATAPFTPVPPNKRDALVVPDGYRHDVVVRWGDPVEAGSPAFDVNNQTPEAAAQQFGYNNDYAGLVPLDEERALLVVNHEYTDGELMFPTGAYDDATMKQIEMASHGMSVLMVRRGRVPGSWRRVSPTQSEYNRRIHVGSTFRLTGPAAGDPRMRTTADPTGTTVSGTLNNCAGGTTPWGTILSGEENFNGYFDASGTLAPAYADSYARYGITGSGRGWSDVDPRFDLTTEPHEPFRFGWVVELDPMRPDAAPRKRTMLGRLKHEGANISLTPGGRVVAYMGDDERNDYFYKFVSRDLLDESGTAAGHRHNMTLLDHGTLYVARFTDEAPDAAPEYDGTGRWLPLASDTESFVDGMSVADVLINTRLAADAVAPTKMDRPEDVQGNPVNGKVYLALTNNSGRGTTVPPDEANPITTSMTRDSLGGPLVPKSGNRNGYVLELTPFNGNHGHGQFTWQLMLVCGDPAAPETYFAGYDPAKVSPISCPDNVAFDSAGNLWISTDGNVLGSNDGIFRVPVAGAERGHVEQFLTVPRGAEACGPLVTDGDRAVWVAVQHPGEVDGATFEAPASTWPHTDDFPRPSVCVAYRAR